MRKTAALLLVALLFCFSVEAQAITKTSQKEFAVRAMAETFKEYNNGLSRDTARKYAELVFEAAGKFGENPFVIAAIIIVESTAKTNARSNGNYGLMQVRWRVHKKDLIKKYGLKNDKDLFKPKENIFAGTGIFSKYRAGGSLEAGLKKYAGGASTTDKVKAYMAEIERKYAKINSSQKR